MFRKELTKDLLDVFRMKEARLCAIDDETEVIYFNIMEVVEEPILGSGYTHFRVYGTLGINQDEDNGQYGSIRRALLTSPAPNRNRFQLQGDEVTHTQTLFQQHRILSEIQCVWSATIEWNKAPKVTGGELTTITEGEQHE